MAKEKKEKEVKQPAHEFIWSKKNLWWLFGGLALIAIGFLLMIGGSQPADQFDPKVIYDFKNITVSTLIVLSGFVVAGYSIFRKP